MMDEKKSDKGKKFLRSAIVVVCSAFAGSAAQIFVMIPNGLTSGGLPGQREAASAEESPAMFLSS